MGILAADFRRSAHWMGNETGKDEELEEGDPDEFILSVGGENKLVYDNPSKF